jgi:hypothetical protein
LLSKLFVPAWLALALLPASAQADVLVLAPKTRVSCGAAIHVGVWAQPGTPGSRVVRITARDRRTGIVWWARTVTATTSRWREWYLPSGRRGQCGATTITYRGPFPPTSWVVRFRSEGV